MSSERELHERASEIFAAASDLPSERRRDFLATACDGDDVLRSEVESLLDHDSRAEQFLERTAQEDAGLAPLRPPADPARPIESVGPYRILDVLGEGGMGVVYEAEQSSPHRRVALKVLRDGLATPGARRRFEFEAEVLGRLQHHGIARIFEAGTAETPNGLRPYFAMELVRGRPLTEFARSENLGIRARLELFSNVCYAIEHAHQKGVVHRDLKPSNITVDAEGNPHVLDFGIARLVDRDERKETWRTGQGQLLGTLPYMSPEQASGNRDAIDTRSDVYSLGVILFELLAGQLPYDLSHATFPQAVLTITGREPTNLGSIDRRLAGDLDTIVAKALSKERERRYSSASDLAADVRRFLDDEPIVARPASTLYQLRKFAARNKALVTGASLAFVALLIGFISTNFALRRTTSAEKRQAQTVAEMDRFSDQLLADDLMQEADGLFPRDAQNGAAMGRWLERAEGLLERLVEHQEFAYRHLERTYLEQVERGAIRPDPLRLPDWSAATIQQRWRQDLVEKTRNKRAELEARMHDVGFHYRYATDVPRISGALYRREWDLAINAIARSPRYGGLRLRPQLDLAPLRENPDTGLWEFWHVGTGTRPASAANDVDWIVETDTAVVLVLLPAGRFWMGAEVPGSVGDPPRNVDPRAMPREGPVHEVELDAFFLSKYEMTQGQWLRWTGENPAVLNPQDDSFPGPRATLCHPIENLNWHEAQGELSRLGMTLPTEAQWEYACRAGTNTAFWTGDSPRSLQLAENLADRHEEHIEDLAWARVADLYDGYLGHAPVGSLRPNPFGLYDMGGNVSEWVLDYKVSYDEPYRPGDGYRAQTDSDYGLRRGGSYRTGASRARSAGRFFDPRGNRGSLFGVRPTRRVE